MPVPASPLSSAILGSLLFPFPCRITRHACVQQLGDLAIIRRTPPPECQQLMQEIYFKEFRHEFRHKKAQEAQRRGESGVSSPTIFSKVFRRVADTGGIKPCMFCGCLSGDV